MPRSRPRRRAQARISTPAAGPEGERRGGAGSRPQVDLDKTVVHAGVSGRVEQFALRVGDIVNPFMRPAGVLIPTEPGAGRLQAGFGQIEAQVMKVGMIAEVTCVSKPFTIIPMVVTGVQDFIAAGQFRGRRPADRRADQLTAAGHHPGLHGAALRGRTRGRASRQQLHRQRLHQQSRRAAVEGHQLRPLARTCTWSTPSGSCTP